MTVINRPSDTRITLRRLSAQNRNGKPRLIPVTANKHSDQQQLAGSWKVQVPEHWQRQDEDDEVDENTRDRTANPKCLSAATVPLDSGKPVLLNRIAHENGPKNDSKPPRPHQGMRCQQQVSESLGMRLEDAGQEKQCRHFGKGQSSVVDYVSREEHFQDLQDVIHWNNGDVFPNTKMYDRDRKCVTCDTPWLRRT